MGTVGIDAFRMNGFSFDITISVIDSNTVRSLGLEYHAIIFIKLVRGEDSGISKAKQNS